MATPVTSPLRSNSDTVTRSYAGPMVLAVLLFGAGPAHAQTKATINRKTKSFDLVADIRLDHRIFGYAAPDTLAKKLLLFSVFTNDVKDNPHHYPLGAYYGTSDLPKGDDIRFAAASAGFVKLTYLTASKQATTFYIKREFIRFD